MDTSTPTSRRSFLQGVGGVMAVGAVAPLASPVIDATVNAWPVAVSDRAMGIPHSLGAFAVARDGGATGVEIDFGRLGGRRELQSRLVPSAGRRLFADAATAAGVSIAAVSFGALADVAFAADPRVDAIMDDFLYTLHAGRIRVGVLPLGRADDLTDAGVRARVVGRLAAFKARAGRDGTVLAIDAPLPPADLAALLDEIDSPAVRACVGDADTFAAVGARRVAQIRFRYHGVDPVAGGVRLGSLRRVAETAGWRGWVVVDRPASSGGAPLDDVGRAVRQVRSIFA